MRPGQNATQVIVLTPGFSHIRHNSVVACKILFVFPQFGTGLPFAVWQNPSLAFDYRHSFPGFVPPAIPLRLYARRHSLLPVESFFIP